MTAKKNNASKAAKSAIAKAAKAATPTGGAVSAAPAERRPTIEDGSSGPIKIEMKCKEPKELRAASKRGRLLEMLRSAKGVKQEDMKSEFGWQDRDCGDALRLLAKTNGVNSERNEKGVWHATKN